MSFDYSKLSGLINEKCGTRANFAELIGLSEKSVSAKMNGKRQWKQTEICKICQILKIKESDISTYFFTKQVQIN